MGRQGVLFDVLNQLVVTELLDLLVEK